MICFSFAASRLRLKLFFFTQRRQNAEYDLLFLRGFAASIEIIFFTQRRQDAEYDLLFLRGFAASIEI
jgi:hypothetical protein